MHIIEYLHIEYGTLKMHQLYWLTFYAKLFVFPANND